VSWDFADGPPEPTVAFHQWAPPDGLNAPPIINDAGGVGPGGTPMDVTWPPTLPWIRLHGVTGWRAAPEGEDNREGKTYPWYFDTPAGGPGEIAYSSRILGKTLVYEATVEAASLQDCSNVLNSVLNGYAATRYEGVMTVTPHPNFGGGIAWTFPGRVLDLTPERSFRFEPRDKEGATFQWDFSLSIRMSDPRFYDVISDDYSL